MTQQGIQWLDIRCLFLTHAHDDHAGFLNELMQKCPHIPVIANPDSLPGNCDPERETAAVL